MLKVLSTRTETEAAFFICMDHVIISITEYNRLKKLDETLEVFISRGRLMRKSIGHGTIYFRSEEVYIYSPTEPEIENIRLKVELSKIKQTKLPFFGLGRKVEDIIK